MLWSYIKFAYEALYLHVIRQIRIYTVIFSVVLIIIPSYVLFVPASNFPHGAQITIEENASFSETAVLLKNEQLISSIFLFKVLTRVTNTDTSLRSGRYVFTKPIGNALLLYRLANGISGIEAKRVTFPEGIPAREMAEILSTALPGFPSDVFLAEAKQYEGYLFPDTYDFYVDSSPNEIVTRMRSRFTTVWESLATENPRGVASGVSEPEERVVTMASILEKETKPGVDREIVSGILWKRISIGMALQVDAVFGYIHDTDTFHPSFEDLEVDSPYNTYRYPDLPPGPIGNPGEDALYAALHPEPSPYLYYLTGKDGAVHYAKTFEEHKKNRELYLR